MKAKNLFFSMLAMSGLLFATSCEQDRLLDDPSNGDSVTATFTISTSDCIGTRALVGDGTKADKVACAVYDAEGVELRDLYQIIDVEDKVATYKISLAKGQSYRVAFFAYNSAAAAYDVDDLKNIKVKNAQKSNVEERDAFTAYVDVAATVNDIQEKVTLYRPFAQLNLGVDAVELAEAVKAGVSVSKTSIKVSNVYDAFSAYDNAVAADEAKTMEFALNDLPSDLLEVDVNRDGTIGDDEKYIYLALNYLLVGDAGTEKSLTDVEFVWETADGKSNDPATDFINIPVQRNYRTNIIGKLLTNTATFTVVIDERFNDPVFDSPENDYIVYENGAMKATVSTDEELQRALDEALENSSTIITLAADITGDVVVPEKKGASVMIDGSGYKYNGQIAINGYSNYTNNATTIFRNINFETSEYVGNGYFIYAHKSDGTTNTRYPDNVVVENCSFNAVEGSAAYHTVGSVYLHSALSGIITNCTATNMHSLLGAESCKGTVSVDNVKTINCKNSVSFNNTMNAEISNSALTSVGEDGYGVRVKGEQTGYGLKVKDCDIEAFVPVLVRNMTADGYSIEFVGENTLVTSNGYQVVISNTDYSIDKETGELLPLVSPTGTYTLSGADDFNVYPRDVLAGTEAELIAALKGLKTLNAVVKLTDNITISTKWDNRNTGAKTTVPTVIDGQGHTLKFTGEINDGGNNFSVFRFENNATVRNLKFDLSEASGSNNRFRAISAKAGLVVDNCDFIGNRSVSNTRGVIFGEGQRDAKFDAAVSITNSRFTDWKRGVTDNENAKDARNVVVQDNTFTNAHVYVSAYEKITFTGNTMSSGSIMNITSYSSAATAKVKATDNVLVLDSAQDNVIGNTSRLFDSANVEAQNGIVVYTIQK